MRREREKAETQRGDGDRGQWASKIEYILVVAGNVVGLGNVWRFPYLCYKNGGGAFLVPYALFAVVCGIPLFLLETFIGQYTQEGFITCWRKLCPLAQGIGYAHSVIKTFDFSFIIVQVWALFYLVSSFRSQLPWDSCNNTWNTANCVSLDSVTTNLTSLRNITSAATEFWECRMLGLSTGIEELGSVRWELALCLLACWLLCYFSIWKGVRSSGKVAYVTATFPYVMLLVLLGRGVTLAGAGDGIYYYLYPDLKRLANYEVWLEAGSQICYSYSLSTGTLIVLSSYNKHNNNYYKDCFWICLLNSATSFLAGFVVFSVLGFMAHSYGVTVDTVVESGPGLAFIAYPQAAAMMPFPQFWTVCFFLMLLFLGVDTHFVSVECLITSISDLFPKLFRKPRNHEIFALVVCLCFFIMHLMLVTELFFSLTCSDCCLPPWSGTARRQQSEHIKGGIYIFQLLDYYGTTRACYYFMVLSECLAMAWMFGVDRVVKIIEEMTGCRPLLIFKLCWKYINPVLGLVSFILYVLDYKHLKFNDTYVYPDWAYALGWMMTLSSVLMVPLWAAGQMFFTAGSFRQRLSILGRPAEDPTTHGGESATEETAANLIMSSAPA